MGFNISGIAINKNYEHSLNSLFQEFHWNLEGPEEVNFETASENWKDEDICDIFFTNSGTLILVNMDLCIEPWSVKGANTLTFALSETSMAFNLNYCEDKKLKRSIMEVNGNRMNDKGKKFPDENEDVSEIIWDQIGNVIGKKFMDIDFNEKALRFRFIKKN